MPTLHPHPDDHDDPEPMTDTELLAWATAEMQRQLEPNHTCSVCGTVATVGYHATCDNCGKPVCGTCAMQVADGHFCPTCPPTTPF